jgi:hypothetical protein
MHERPSKEAAPTTDLPWEFGETAEDAGEDATG